MTLIHDFLRARSVGDLLPWTAQLEAMELFDLPCRVVEELVLAMGLLPSRYQRNRRMLDTARQLRLFRSRVAVIGCGGLGGYLLEELARLGVGTIVAVDPDSFEEHNLNRQLLATPATLGLAKVEAAALRLGQVNPAVRVIPHLTAFTSDSGAQLLQGVDLAVDALDSIPARLDLVRCCSSQGIPMVHGAIAGWYGQVMTCFPGEAGLERIYRSQAAGRGVEQQLGNPSFTPAVVASLQAAEVCKVLLGEGDPLRGRMLYVDLAAMDFTQIPIIEDGDWL